MLFEFVWFVDWLEICGLSAWVLFRSYCVILLWLGLVVCWFLLLYCCYYVGWCWFECWVVCWALFYLIDLVCVFVVLFDALLLFSVFMRLPCLRVLLDIELFSFAVVLLGLEWFYCLGLYFGFRCVFVVVCLFVCFGFVCLICFDLMIGTLVLRVEVNSLFMLVVSYCVWNLCWCLRLLWIL